MIDLRLIQKVALGNPAHPLVPDLREIKEDTLFFDSLTRGLGICGDPGTGKTTWEVMESGRYATTYLDRPIIIFDSSGSFTNDFIEMVALSPPAQREALMNRIILDIPGHEDLVVPKPMFSAEYGLSNEELVDKAVNLLEELNAEKVSNTPMMAQAIQVTAPNIFRLLMAIKDDNDTCWQVTEAKKLLLDTYQGGLLERACKAYGRFSPEAKWYLEKEVLRANITPQGREARVTALVSALQVIEPRSLRARYGYARPGITYNEIIEKGLIYIVCGEKLTNQAKAQAWVFWDEFASLRSVINRRTPHNSDDKPVLFISDEVYRLYEIKGMAQALGEISTYYRSRKLMPVIVIQAFWQLDDVLQQQFWNLGNIVTFRMDNQKDAFLLAQQLFKYDSAREKFGAKGRFGNPVAEPDRGQYLNLANWIQNLGWRQVVMRRYYNERDKDPFIRFVAQTREKPQGQLPAPISEIKESLLQKRAIPIKDALAIINQRKLVYKTQKKRPSL